MEGAPIIVRLVGGNSINLVKVANVDVLHRIEGDAFEINTSDDHKKEAVHVYLDGRVRPLFNPKDVKNFLTAWDAFQWEIVH